MTCCVYLSLSNQTNSTNQNESFFLTTKKPNQIIMIEPLAKLGIGRKR